MISWACNFIKDGNRSLDMDNVELAALCTQNIILDIIGERGISVDEFSKRISSATVESWRTHPAMTYEEFLRSCNELKGVSAPKLFVETKKRMTEGWKPSPSTGEDSGAGDGGDDRVDVRKAHMDVPSALLMDWDAVVESMAAAMRKDVQDVRALFVKAPTKKDANTIVIHSVKHGAKNDDRLSKLVRIGMKKAGIDGGDSLSIMFDDDADN